MKIFYHSGDLDGKCSAAILRYFFEGQSEVIRLVPYDNGRDLPLRQMREGETIFFVDCCFSPIEEMIELANQYNLIWIDHHISSMKEAEKLGFNPEGIREVGKAACELTWEYVCEKIYLPGKEHSIPYGVQMIGRHDVWDLRFSEDIHAYQYGLSSMENDPRTDRGMRTWSEIVFSYNEFFSSSIINDGKAIGRYLSQLNRQLMNSYSFTTRIDGKKALAINRQFVNSSTFDSQWDNSKYDLMIAFAKFKDTKLGFHWKVSMYTDKTGIDVSKIAQKYGGGGHGSVAGFVTSTLPFRIEEELCTD